MEPRTALFLTAMPNATERPPAPWWTDPVRTATSWTCPRSRESIPRTPETGEPCGVCGFPEMGD